MTDYLVLQRRPLSARLVFLTARRISKAEQEDELASLSPSSDTTTTELIVKEGAFKEGEGGVSRVRRDVRAGDVVRVEAATGEDGKEEEEQEGGANTVVVAGSAVVVVRSLVLRRRWRDGGGKDGRTFNWAPAPSAAAPSPAAPSPPSPSQAACKFFINTGRCAKGSDCPYAHDAASAEQRRAWVGERAAARRRRAGGDAQEEEDGEGGGHGGGAAAKAQRARIFAAWIGAAFFGGEKQEGAAAAPPPDSVVDVAGGRGALTFELAAVLGSRSSITLVDPRPLRLNRRQALRLRLRQRQEGSRTTGGGGGGKARWRVDDVLTGEVVSESRPAEDGGDDDEDDDGRNTSSPPPQVAVFRQARALFGPELWRSEAWRAALESAGTRPLVVALHPDQATDAALDYALERGLPFAIVPCCVFPELFSERRLRPPALSSSSLSSAAAASADAGAPVRSYEDLVAYLVQRSGGEATMLPFVGRHVVVYGGGGAGAVDVMAADRAAAREAARPPPEFARRRPSTAGGGDGGTADEEEDEDEDEHEEEEEGEKEGQGGDQLFDGAALLADGRRRKGVVN